MKILIDSDIIIDFLNNQKSAIVFFKKFSKNNSLFISIVSWLEVMYGFKKNNYHNKSKIFDEFLADFQVSIIPIDKKVAEEYLKIKIIIEKEKKSLADFDLFIGATAIARNLTLATRNKKHFQRIKNLLLFNEL